MPARRPTAAAWWLCAFALATLTGGVVLKEVNGAPSNETLVEQVGLFLASTAFPVVGALVLSREPRNALGWVFVAVGACIGVLVLSTEYAYYGLVKNDRAPGATLAAWFEQWPGFRAWGSSSPTASCSSPPGNFHLPAGAGWHGPPAPFSGS